MPARWRSAPEPRFTEWRVDHFTAVGDQDRACWRWTEIAAPADILLLFTFRVS